jgi:hypothetical protein
MKKITMMPILNANATTHARTMTGAQRAGIVLAVVCLLTLVSSAGAQVTILYNFGTHAGDSAHPTIPELLFRAVMGTSTALPMTEELTIQVQFSRSLLRGKSASFTVSME